MIHLRGEEGGGWGGGREEGGEKRERKGRRVCREGSVEGGERKGRRVCHCQAASWFQYGEAREHSVLPKHGLYSTIVSYCEPVREDCSHTSSTPVDAFR